MNRKTTVTCIALTIATAAPLLFSIPASAVTAPAPTPSSSATPPASTSTPPASEGDAAAPIVADAGVYDLAVVSDNRGALVPGVKGKVSYRVQGDQDAPGFVPALVKKGQSMSWVTSLPKGVILESEIIDGNNHLFDRSYVKRTNPDGTMDIIGTYTAKYGDQLLDFSRSSVKIPVRVTDQLGGGRRSPRRSPRPPGTRVTMPPPVRTFGRTTSSLTWAYTVSPPLLPRGLPSLPG